MSLPIPKFTKSELKSILALLDEELCRQGLTGEICIVGGAMMILAFGGRHSTREIYALGMAPSSVRAAAIRVAQANGLPENWLNDGAKGFASELTFEVKELLRFTHLRILAPPPEYVLAPVSVSVPPPL